MFAKNIFLKKYSRSRISFSLLVLQVKTLFQMHPSVEKLERLLNEAMSGNANSKNEFFNELWISGPSVTADQFRNVTERFYEWMQPRQTFDAAGFSSATLAMAYVEFNDGKYELALQLAFKAQKLFEELKNEDGVQACAVMVGSVYRTLGDVELAVKYLLEAYHKLSQTGNYKVFVVFDAYTLAEIHSENRQFDEALKFYSIAEKFCAEIGNKSMSARVLTGMGTLCKLQKKYSLALDYLNQSLKMCEEENNGIVKARVFTELGNYYSETGNFETAIGFHQQALTLREELKLPNAQITNLIQLGDIFRAQGKLDDAISILSKALLIAEEIKVKPKIFQIHKLLSDIFQAKGDTGKCLFHHKAFHQIRDEVQHEDNEKKLKNLHLIFEAEQTNKENEIIKSQNEEIAHKNAQLQRIVDELKHTKASRQAKTITLAIAVLLFLLEEIVLRITEGAYEHENIFLSISIKCVIILSLKPIENFVESYWMKKIVRETI